MIKPSEYDTLIHFINERENVRRRRESGHDKPWTNDPILQSYRFCNVNREDDRVTMWINEHIRRPFDGHPALWFNLVIARFFNKPTTLSHIGFIDDFDPDKFIEIVDILYNDPDIRVYNNAYMIRGASGEDAKFPKHHYLARRTFLPMWEARHERPSGPAVTCQDWSVWLRKFFGMGDFMRNQIITDMKYTHLLRDAPDVTTFCLAGPGTTRGLNRLYGRPVKASRKPEALHKELIEVRARLQEDRRVLAPGIWVFDDLNNLSNCFCEFDKYRRAENGEGTPKQRYLGR